ncbi:hypothetical protein FBU31_000461 [Coemansia sp. 'formosensis']|nr:hypothetical protein FBU31_000461 [Coemansia sp. 'formosensis']
MLFTHTSGYLLALAAYIQVVTAHTNLFSVSSDGSTTNPTGLYIRPYFHGNAPIRDPKSPLFLCRSEKMTPDAAKILPIVAGNDLTVVWHHNNVSPPDDTISPSHRGPCFVYMAPMESNGQGYSWFKIYEQGYDPATKLWCTDVLRENHGKLSVKIPTQINNGKYLVRTEIIALHDAGTIGGAQFYPNCAQISVTGATSGSPELYDISEVYSATDPGILINVRRGVPSYKIPGPPVYSP